MWRGIAAVRCTERPEEPNGFIFRMEEEGAMQNFGPLFTEVVN